MAIRVVRLGSERSPGEGTRIGTVRRPPRGIAKSDYAEKNFYDVWLPTLAPSAELVKAARTAATTTDWRRFERRYRREMMLPDANAVLNTLATLSHRADFSVGCYCPDESRCHRGVLRQILVARGADVR